MSLYDVEDLQCCDMIREVLVRMLPYWIIMYGGT
jgi:hypothetical protein